MPVFNSRQLLTELEAKVQVAITTVKQLRNLDQAILLRPGPEGRWSPLQHLHHLNFYAGFYTDSIERTLVGARPARGATYRSGWLGNYFTNIIGPAAEEQPLRMKMKTPPSGRPPATETLQPEAVIEEFLALQKRLLYLLQKSRATDLGSNRVTTALGSWLRLKLGDTFRFVTAHQERHFQHIARDMASAKIETGK